jgi:hypothetical protein
MLHSVMQAAATPDIPGIQQISALPSVLRALLTGVSDDEARWKPLPERWSISEVLGHLCHVEANSLRYRAQVILRNDNSEFPDYDPSVFEAAGAFERANIAAALDEFEHARGVSMELLRTVTPAALSRTGRHAALGEVTMSNLLNHWALHDLSHLRQIVELIRAVKFYEGAGEWSKYHRVNP